MQGVITGSTYNIERKSKELAELLTICKIIFVKCGGEVGDGRVGAKAGFMERKSAIITRIEMLHQKIANRDSAQEEDRGGVNYLRQKYEVERELQELELSIDELEASSKRELAKLGGKAKPEDIAARKDVVESTVAEFHSVFQRVKGHAHKSSDEMQQAGVGLSNITAEQLKKGDYVGAGVKKKRQELSGEQVQKLEMISRQVQEQDSILDEMGKELDQLKDLGLKIGDEMQLQEKMLEDLETTTDKTQERLDDANKRLDGALETMNDKASNFCMYIVCIVLLLGIAVVAYNMISAKKTA